MNVLVVFYSMTGNTLELAKAVKDGAEEHGAVVRMRQVRELIPDYVFSRKPELWRTKEAMKDIPFATNDDLRWADGVAFGSPTRYGNMSAQLKEFIDGTGELWMKGELVGKVATVFTSTGTQHGGQESTLLSMMFPLFHLGFLVQGLPYAEQQQMGMEYIHGGSPYGASSVSGPDGTRRPTDNDLTLARAAGRRLAVSAQALKQGREVSAPQAAWRLLAG